MASLWGPCPSPCLPACHGQHQATQRRTPSLHVAPRSGIALASTGAADTAAAGSPGGGSTHRLRKWHRCEPLRRRPRVHAAAASALPQTSSSPSPQQEEPGVASDGDDGGPLLPEALQRICGDLPIRRVVLDVLAALNGCSGAVLQAPPGAGKTTTVPLALLQHNPAWLRASSGGGGDGRPPTILVLEPRRVAAKAAARRMAAILGEKVGATVGYRVRLETCVSKRTRIEVVTEGVLLRRLQNDPELTGVAAILFDEFHERNLDADLALALTCDLQAVARPELRVLVMSATLGGGLAERCAALMGPSAGAGGQPVPVVVSQGRSFPVRTVYLGAPGQERGALEEAVAEAVVAALDAQAKRKAPPGDVLCFLPGVAEINNAERLLLRRLGGRLDVVQLHGGMAPRDQDRVVMHKAPQGSPARRVILATPIAESSLTLNNVSAVVDTGLRRSPAYDASTGVNRLRTERVSAASAEQRAGRAGRQGPGVAYRLWEAQDVLAASSPPEIEQADLAPMALQLSCWGVAVAGGAAGAPAARVPVRDTLPWLDPPPEGRLADAAELLTELGALSTTTGAVTAQGRAMAGMGVHPRLAAMVQRGSAPPLSAPELSCVMASLLSERDVMPRGGASSGGLGGSRGGTASVALRLAVLAAVAGAGNPRDVAGVEGLLASLRVGVEEVVRAADVGTARRVLLGARSVAAALQRSEGGGSGATTDEEGVEEEEDEAGDASDVDMERTGTDSDGEWSGASASANGGPTAAATAAAWTAQWLQQAGREGLAGALVALAYPDRLAVRAERSNARASFALSGGGTVRLASEDDPLSQSAELLAVAELGGARERSGQNDTVRLAGSLSRNAVERYLSGFVAERSVVFWASGSKAVLARRQRRLGRLVLDEKSIPVSDEQALPALLQGFKELGGVRGVGLAKDVEAWRQRVLWLRRAELSTSDPPQSSLPDLSDEALLASAAAWLPPYLLGARSKADMVKLPWQTILQSMMSREDRARVEAQVPSFVLLPTGTRAAIDYGRDPPAARARIQEVFGLSETPRVAGGRVPVVLELLSPSQQPLQITADLAAFWANSYQAVRREMKGRYPKHLWPDNPLEVEATRMTKKAMDRASAAAAEQQAPAAQGKAAGGKGPGGKGGASKRS